MYPDGVLAFVKQNCIVPEGVVVMVIMGICSYGWYWLVICVKCGKSLFQGITREKIGHYFCRIGTFYKVWFFVQGMRMAEMRVY